MCTKLHFLAHFDAIWKLDLGWPSVAQKPSETLTLLRKQTLIVRGFRLISNQVQPSNYIYIYININLHRSICLFTRTRMRQETAKSPRIFQLDLQVLERALLYFQSHLPCLAGDLLEVAPAVAGKSLGVPMPPKLLSKPDQPSQLHPLNLPWRNEVNKFG